MKDRGGIEKLCSPPRLGHQSREDLHKKNNNYMERERDYRVWPVQKNKTKSVCCAGQPQQKGKVASIKSNSGVYFATIGGFLFGCGWQEKTADHFEWRWR